MSLAYRGVIGSRRPAVSGRARNRCTEKDAATGVSFFFLSILFFSFSFLKTSLFFYRAQEQRADSLAKTT